METFVTKTCASAALLLLATASAHAIPVQYASRAAFESAISNEITDTFNSPAYGFINDNATMEALSAGSINYASTGFSNLNIVQSDDTLCWGCNGSGQIDLDSTTIGTSNGVFGFGIDIKFNASFLPYDAFVTFGDGSTQNYALGAAQFFGLTAGELIKSVRFGPNGGSTTTNGSFGVDNVSIGNEGGVRVPEPTGLVLALAGLVVAGKVRGVRHRG